MNFTSTVSIVILVLISCTDARFILSHLLEQRVMQRMDWESVGNETVRLFDECIAKSKDISFPGKVCSKLTDDLAVKKFPHIIQNFAKCMEQQTGSSACLNFPEDFKSTIETWQSMLVDQYEQRGRGKAIKCMVEAQQNATHYCQMSDKMTVQAVHKCSNTTGMDEVHQVFLKCIDQEPENKNMFIESQKSVFPDHFVEDEIRKESMKKGSVFYVEKESKNENIIDTMFGEGRGQSKIKNEHNMKNVGMLSMFGLNSIEENEEFASEDKMEFGLASLFGMNEADTKRENQEDQFSLVSMFGGFQEDSNDVTDNKMFSKSMFGMPSKSVAEERSEIETEKNDEYEILFGNEEMRENTSWDNDDDVEFFGRMWDSDEAISAGEWENDDDEDDLYGLLWDGDDGEWESGEDDEDGDLFGLMSESEKAGDTREWDDDDDDDDDDAGELIGLMLGSFEQSETIDWGKNDDYDEDELFELMWGSEGMSDTRDKENNDDENDLFGLLWESGEASNTNGWENNDREDGEDDLFRLMWENEETSGTRSMHNNDDDEKDLYELMWGKTGANEESYLENNKRAAKYKRNEANLLAESMFSFGGIDEKMEDDLFNAGEHEDMSKKMMDLIGASDVMMKQLLLQLPNELA